MKLGIFLRVKDKNRGVIRRGDKIDYEVKKINEKRKYNFYWYHAGLSKGTLLRSFLSNPYVGSTRRAVSLIKQCQCAFHPRTKCFDHVSLKRLPPRDFDSRFRNHASSNVKFLHILDCFIIQVIISFFKYLSTTFYNMLFSFFSMFSLLLNILFNDSLTDFIVFHWYNFIL